MMYGSNGKGCGTKALLYAPGVAYGMVGHMVYNKVHIILHNIYVYHAAISDNVATCNGHHFGNIWDSPGLIAGARLHVCVCACAYV